MPRRRTPSQNLHSDLASEPLPAGPYVCMYMMRCLRQLGGWRSFPLESFRSPASASSNNREGHVWLRNPVIKRRAQFRLRLRQVCGRACGIALPLFLAIDLHHELAGSGWIQLSHCAINRHAFNPATPRPLDTYENDPAKASHAWKGALRHRHQTAMSQPYRRPEPRSPTPALRSTQRAARTTTRQPNARQQPLSRTRE